MELEVARAIAERISCGHAYDKHVLRRNEFGKLLTRNEFAQLILIALTEPTEIRFLRDERQAYWQQNLGLLVIYDQRNEDFGSAFVPHLGKAILEVLE